MVTCNNCGHQNTEGNYICSNCGHVVNQHTKKNARPRDSNKMDRENARQVSKNNTGQQSNNKQQLKNV